MRVEGNIQSRVWWLVHELSVHAKASETEVLAAEHRTLIFTKLSKQGLSPLDDCCFIYVSDFAELRNLIQANKPKVLVLQSESLLQEICALKGIHKWHSSILRSTQDYGCLPCIPTFDFSSLNKSPTDKVFLDLVTNRAAFLATQENYTAPPTNFIHCGDLATFNFYKPHLLAAAELSVDIETGKNQINTVGFAWGDSNAIAIKTLPGFYTEEEFLELWKGIATILESNIPKIAQNAVYEYLYFSYYGIEFNNVIHDTMWACKFLYPELEQGLDNVGRIFTLFPYWKDDNDDWTNIGDWQKHLDYNCKDTLGTLVAYRNQKLHLQKRKLDKLFYGYIMQYFYALAEMCEHGIGVNEEKLQSLKEEATLAKDNFSEIIQQEALERLGREINPRSPKQVKDALKELGIKLPVQKGKESSDKKALVKLKRKYPDEPIIAALIKFSAKNKQLSSYLNFTYSPDNKMRYSLNGVGTETGRWSGYKDPWGNGVNPQTVPKFVRKVFRASQDKILMQIDLSQAESRYVAYDSPEPILIEMLEQKRDVHKYVASKIFNVEEHAVTKDQRTLGKKSGHSANYGVQGKTFAEACLVEMGVVLTDKEADNIIQGYYRVFPGILARQRRIKKEVMEKRFLKTPLGRERYFYGRINDDTFRQAYAYEPQSTIPDVTNHLLLHLRKHMPHLNFLLQVHDSLLIEGTKEDLPRVNALARDYQSWHPVINLRAGQLIIPIELEWGTHWEPMEGYGN